MKATKLCPKYLIKEVGPRLHRCPHSQKRVAASKNSNNLNVLSPVNSISSNSRHHKVENSSEIHWRCVYKLHFIVLTSSYHNFLWATFDTNNKSEFAHFCLLNHILLSPLELHQIFEVKKKTSKKNCDLQSRQWTWACNIGMAALTSAHASGSFHRPLWPSSVKLDVDQLTCHLVNHQKMKESKIQDSITFHTATRRWHSQNRWRPPSNQPKKKKKILNNSLFTKRKGLVKQPIAWISISNEASWVNQNVQQEI